MPTNQDPEYSRTIGAYLAAKAREGKINDPMARYFAGAQAPQSQPQQAQRRRNPAPTQASLAATGQQEQDSDALASLLGKLQSGFGVVEPGTGIEWGRVPEAKRKLLAPVIGDEPPIGWALGDLDERDMATLRRVIGDDGWNEWEARNRELSATPDWKVGDRVTTRADIEAVKQRMLEDMRRNRAGGA